MNLIINRSWSHNEFIVLIIYYAVKFSYKVKSENSVTRYGKFGVNDLEIVTDYEIIEK